MGFFDDLRVPRRDSEEEPEAPVWFEAPQNWLGGVVPAQLLVARSESAAVYLSRLVAYPSGFELTIDALTRARRPIGYPFDPMPARRQAGGDELPKEPRRSGEATDCIRIERHR